MANLERPDRNLAALAVNGGFAIRNRPFPPRAVSTSADLDAVTRVFNRAIRNGESVGYGGPEEEAYSSEFAEFLGGGYADGVNSGTSAVFIALKALGIEPFSEVIIGAITDPGALMAVALCNCVPVIADSQFGSYNSGPAEISECLSPRTAAIVMTHIAGEPADAPAIARIARQREVPLIEDCAQAHGATIRGQSVGTFGSIAAFSTMYSKHFNTGGQGGIVFTRDHSLYESVRRYADRGKPYGLSEGATNTVASHNLNMDEIHAAIGRVQLSSLRGAIATRKQVAKSLISEIETATDRMVTGPEFLPHSEASFWFLRLYLDEARLGVSKKEFVVALNREGIPVLGDPSIPHMFEWFRERRVFGTSGYPWASPSYTGERNPQFSCPNAQSAIAAHLHLPVTERWTDSEIKDTVAAITKVSSVYYGTKSHEKEF